MKFRIVIALAIFSVAGLVSAGQAWSPSDPVEIKYVYPYTDGLAFVVDGYSHHLSTCNNGSKFEIHSSHGNYQVMSSTLLMAFASGKKIRFSIDDSQSAGCSPDITQMIVLP